METSLQNLLQRFHSVSEIFLDQTQVSLTSRYIFSLFHYQKTLEVTFCCSQLNTTNFISRCD